MGPIHHFLIYSNYKHVKGFLYSFKSPFQYITQFFNSLKIKMGKLEPLCNPYYPISFCFHLNTYYSAFWVRVESSFCPVVFQQRWRRRESKERREGGRGSEADTSPALKPCQGFALACSLYDVQCSRIQGRRKPAFNVRVTERSLRRRRTVLFSTYSTMAAKVFLKRVISALPPSTSLVQMKTTSVLGIKHNFSFLLFCFCTMFPLFQDIANILEAKKYFMSELISHSGLSF